MNTEISCSEARELLQRAALAFDNAADFLLEAVLAYHGPVEALDFDKAGDEFLEVKK
jgi:hypothetical protein